MGDLQTEIKDFIKEIETNLDYIENADLDTLDDICQAIGQTAVDGCVFALERVITKLTEIAYADTICGYAE